METKQILIEIRVDLQTQALQALSRSLGNLPKALSSVRSRFSDLTGGIAGAFKQLTLWDSLFGRVTQAMIVWAGWRMVWRGFAAIGDAIVGGNERMQTAIQTFTALSGGSREMADTYIGILQRLSLETGASFDQLIENAKRLPTQVGQNFEAFTNLTKKAIVLGMLDPVQGIEGAFLALTNAMEGNATGFRSLIMRFELGNKELVNRILNETANPLEALDRIFKELNIDVDMMTKNLKGTLPVIISGLTNAFQIMFRRLGEPTITRLTEDLGRLRDTILSNEPAMEGFSLAFGEGLRGAYEKVKAFVNEIVFGGAGLDARSWYDAGMNLMTEFSRGMFDAITTYVLPTITSITQMIASFFIGASPPPMGPLSQIREGGEETIKQYVLGMISGMNAADIASLAQTIIENVMSLEAQELAQEKSIKALEEWVEQASDMVQAARDRLQLFDISTADIPERYTRGRRRELELQVMAAEREERSRRKQLDMAREQLQATKEYLQVQKRILSLLEQQQKAAENKEKAEEAAAAELDRSFKPSPYDTEEMKKQIAEYAARFREQLEPLKTVWKEGFSDLGDFVRGLLGKGPGGLETAMLGAPPSEMWQLGAGLSAAVTRIGDAVSAAAKGIKETLGEAGAAWETLPQPVKMVILAAFGLILAPKAVAIVATLNVMGGRIEDVQTFLEFLASVSAAVLAGLFTLGPGGALMMSLIVLVKMALDKENQAEILKWYTPGETGRNYQINVIFEWYILEPIEEWLNKNIADPIEKWWNSWAPPWLQFEKGVTFSLTPLLDELSEEAGAKAAGGLMTGVTDAIEKAKGSLDETMKQKVYLPIVKPFEDINKEVVGQSIVPEMLREIVRLFMRLPIWLHAPLTSLETLMETVITSIRTTWVENLMAMVQATVTSVSAMNAALATVSAAGNGVGGGATVAIEPPDISDLLPSLPWFTPSAYSPAATMAAAHGAAATAPGSLTATIQMDAKQTKRFMEEGIYRGVLELSRAAA